MDCYCAPLLKAARRVAAVYDNELCSFRDHNRSVRPHEFDQDKLRRHHWRTRSSNGVGSIHDGSKRSSADPPRTFDLPAGDDQREAFVELTDKGRVVLSGATQSWSIAQQAVQEKLTDDQLVDFLETLNRLDFTDPRSVNSAYPHPWPLSASADKR